VGGGVDLRRGPPPVLTAEQFKDSGAAAYKERRWVDAIALWAARVSPVLPWVALEWWCRGAGVGPPPTPGSSPRGAP